MEPQTVMCEGRPEWDVGEVVKFPYREPSDRKELAWLLNRLNLDGIQGRQVEFQILDQEILAVWEEDNLWHTTMQPVDA